MILTTTPNIENFKIADYLGIVTGISLKKRESVGFSDSMNMEKYNEAIEKAVLVAKEEAFQQVRKHAKALGANAVVGIETDIEITAQMYSVAVSVTGTAVKVA